MSDLAIGIDLGTTYCCVAIYNAQQDKVTIIPNEIGDNTTPSYVHIEESHKHITIGKAAKNLVQDPFITVYDVKRIIGRRYDDPILQKDIALWPFRVVEENNIPKVVLNNRLYHPEEISAKILAHLKKCAEDFLRQPVTKAIITVPAYFNDGQRQATKDAGTIAGLQVLRILNEPTAAAIAYCHQREYDSEKQNLLIFDLGGGTLDIALLTVNGANIQIKAVDGDTHLGGEDFDNNLVDYCIREFEKKHSLNLAKEKNSQDPAKKTKAAKLYRRLKRACEEVKINISSARSFMLTIDAALGELDMVVRITRQNFNTLNKALFDRCISLMDKVLREASMEKDSIDEVIVVGGSSRIPRIQEMLQEYFNGKQLCKRINGDEAVAYGAAIQAAIMTYKEHIATPPNTVPASAPNPWGQQQGFTSARRMNITLQDVVPLPIGIEATKKGTKELAFNVIIDKNTPVPCTRTRRFVTAFTGHQPTIRIFQGDNPNPAENQFLGMFQTRNLPADCKKGELIEVTMTVTEEGILEVVASYDASTSTDGVVVEEFKGRLSREEVHDLQIQEAAGGH